MNPTVPGDRPHLSGSPQISVLMATRDQAWFLAHAIDSVLSQTLSPHEYELIVVDDGSSDDTAAILASYERENVRVIRVEHMGLTRACNLGLEAARGRYVVRVDSDDTIAPDMLERELEVLEAASQDTVAVYSDRYEVFPGNSVLVVTSETNLFDLIACGVMVRTDVIRAIGGFRSLYWEEYDLFLRLRQRGTFRRIPKPLYSYRKHSAGMTANQEARLQGWKELAAIWGSASLQAQGRNDELDSVLLAAAENPSR